MVIFAISMEGNFNKKDFRVIKHTKVKFDDIAGMDELKKEMMIVVDILKNPKKEKL